MNTSARFVLDGLVVLDTLTGRSWKKASRKEAEVLFASLAQRTKSTQEQTTLITKCEYYETKTGWAYKAWYDNSNDYAVWQYWTEPAIAIQLDAPSAFYKLVEYLIDNGKTLACMPTLVGYPMNTITKGDKVDTPMQTNGTVVDIWYDDGCRETLYTVESRENGTVCYNWAEEQLTPR